MTYKPISVHVWGLAPSLIESHYVFTCKPTSVHVWGPLFPRTNHFLYIPSPLPSPRDLHANFRAGVAVLGSLVGFGVALMLEAALLHEVILRVTWISALTGGARDLLIVAIMIFRTHQTGDAFAWRSATGDIAPMLVQSFAWRLWCQ